MAAPPGAAGTVHRLPLPASLRGEAVVERADQHRGEAVGAGAAAVGVGVGALVVAVEPAHVRPGATLTRREGGGVRTGRDLGPDEEVAVTERGAGLRQRLRERSRVLPERQAPVDGEAHVGTLDLHVLGAAGVRAGTREP